MKNPIKAKHKCSRCGFDLRKEADKGGCKCMWRTHPESPSKSGNAINATNNDYHGGYTE